MKDVILKTAFSVPGFLLLAVLALSSCGQKSVEPERPNVILIMCDDLGWADVGFNGNEIVKTPHLDALASQGLLLNRFYAGSAVCSPTRASCITGRSPYRMGITHANEGHLPKGEITLPELLLTEGYQNGHFGKWHLGTLTTEILDANRGGKPGMEKHYTVPSDHGYHQYFCTESKVPTWDPMFKPPAFDTANGESLRFGWKAIDDGSPKVDYGTYYWIGHEQRDSNNLRGDNSRVIMDRVIPFVDAALNDDSPFFTTIWFHTPHLPLVSDVSHREQYAHLSLQEQLLYGSITAMDEQVGRLIAHLKSRDQFDNTMIWFCSDNGPEDGTPGSAGIYRERKRSLYEGGIRVPGIFSWPNKISAHSVLDYPMVTNDYLPTIVNLLALQYPGADRPLDGEDLSEVLMGTAKERTNPIGFRYAQSKYAWMTHQYKLISVDSGQTFELYDLIADPREQKNIFAKENNVAKDLLDQLTSWNASCSESTAGLDY